MLLTCFSSLVLVPIEKLLKSTLSTPSVLGDNGTMPGVFWPTTNPWDARLTPTPPTGWPRSVASRMKLKWNSLTAVELSVLVSPRASSCARPEFRALKPGTFAPPCATGYGLFCDQPSRK